jgi:hypothetical protein
MADWLAGRYTAQTDYFFHFCKAELRLVYNAAAGLPPASTTSYAMTYHQWVQFVSTRSDKLVPQILSPEQARARLI